MVQLRAPGPDGKMYGFCAACLQSLSRFVGQDTIRMPFSSVHSLSLHYDDPGPL